MAKNEQKKSDKQIREDLNSHWALLHVLHYAIEKRELTVRINEASILIDTLKVGAGQYNTILEQIGIDELKSKETMDKIDPESPRALPILKNMKKRFVKYTEGSTVFNKLISLIEDAKGELELRHNYADSMQSKFSNQKIFNKIFEQYEKTGKKELPSNWYITKAADLFQSSRKIGKKNQTAWKEMLAFFERNPEYLPPGLKGMAKSISVDLLKERVKRYKEWCDKLVAEENE